MGEALEREHSALAMDNAAAALEALSLNIGVPRDMNVQSARALRSHSRLLLASLRDVSSVRFLAARKLEEDLASRPDLPAQQEQFDALMRYDRTLMNTSG